MPEYTEPETSIEETVTDTEAAETEVSSESATNTQDEDQNKDPGKKKNSIILYGVIAAVVAVGSIVAIVLIKKEIL